MKIFLRFFFHLLYHPFAFAYDLVANIVSVGRWKDWVTGILPFLTGTRILEIGFGPGHLQHILLNRGLCAVGIDESWQMALLAKRRLEKQSSQDDVQQNSSHISQSGYTPNNLTRGLAQQLPFCDQAFDSIVATFPAEYIFHEESLLEVKRCLSDGGRFIVLPVALQTGRGALERVMAFLFRVTRQSPVDPLEVVKERLMLPFLGAGFEVDVQEVQIKSSLLLVIVASKVQALLQKEGINVEVVS